MIRITDQYFWNFIFSIFFGVLVVMGMIILKTEAHVLPEDITFFDITIISLASFRLIRLFVYDGVTKFFREQFYNARKIRGGVMLEKPKTGPRRTVADLLTCPWCFGLWAGTFVTFFYLLTPLAFFPVLILAISAVAAFLQGLSRFIFVKTEEI